MKIRKVLFVETQEFDQTGTVLLFDGYRIEVETENELRRVTHRYQLSKVDTYPLRAIERCMDNAIKTELQKQ